MLGDEVGDASRLVWPAVYLESVGPSVFAVLVLCIFVQLAIVSLSLIVSEFTLA
jgi:hypothetical protein